MDRLLRLIELLESVFAELWHLADRVTALEGANQKLMSTQDEILGSIAEIKQDVIDRDAKTKAALERLEAKIDELAGTGVDVTALKTALADVKQTFDTDADAMVAEADAKVPPPAPAPAPTPEPAPAPADGS